MANALIGTQGLQFAPGVKVGPCTAYICDCAWLACANLWVRTQEGSTQWIFVDVIFRSAWIRNMPGPDQHINFKVRVAWRPLRRNAELTVCLCTRVWTCFDSEFHLQ